MHFLTLLSFVTAVLAAPSSTAVAPASSLVPDSFIVTLKAGQTPEGLLAWASVVGKHHAHISHAGWDLNVLNGFAGTFSKQAVNHLKQHAHVAAIEQNSVVHTTATMVKQHTAPWGLQRISEKKRPPNGSVDTNRNFTYTYDKRAGSGVDIYFVDTGINTGHNEFGGRAKWGKTFGGYASADGNGHGTHCAGTAISNTYGVAKGAHAIAVKVLSDFGNGTMADVISGLAWSVSQAKATKRPSIISMSLGGDPSPSLDTAVNNAINSGIHVTVAAGNNNADAKLYSPSRIPAAVTVGASDITDTRAWFSNYGSVVDVFAPGVDIRSTWIGSKVVTNVMSGTSMATPHIAGLIAYLISTGGNTSPANMVKKIQSLGQDNKLSSIPSGTRNELAYNGDGL